MRLLFFSFPLALILHACASAPVKNTATAPAGPAPWPLVWQDEFDTPGLPDPTKWGYDQGNGCPALCGWGNNELQSYKANRPENARVENGHLVITALKEKDGTYSSARMVTKGKAAWKYGRFEIRARLPYGLGIWPAIWMLPERQNYGGWPRSGEIDIMEFVGFLPDKVFASAHTYAFNHTIGTQSTNGAQLADVSTAFHEYALEWTPDYLLFFVDNKPIHRFDNQKTGVDAWPFDQPFYLILNTAVGGNWGGQLGVDDHIWPQQFFIDYVRVRAMP